MLGGEGRPVVGRIQWPDGPPTQGDLSKIFADVRHKMPELPSPPKEIRDQGPDAVREWKKKWRESDEGKAWQAALRQQSSCPRAASVDDKGNLRIEHVTPGRYELGVYVKTNEECLPWERPEMLRFEGEFTVPEIPGSVSDEPLGSGQRAANRKNT